MRAIACSLAAVVAFSALVPAKTANAQKEVTVTAAKAAGSGTSSDAGEGSSLFASEENTLHLTADMADKGQIMISGVTCDRIVVPKEIGAINITLDKSEIGELVVESGSRASILLWATTVAKVTVEEPKLKEIDWMELKHLLADEKTIGQAIQIYLDTQQENERYQNSSPRITTANGAVIGSLTAGAGVSLNLYEGEVGSLNVRSGTKLTHAEIAVEGYHGDITYTGSDSFGIVSLKLKNSEVNRMTVAESCVNNYLLVSGSSSYVDNIEVTGSAKVSFNIPADTLTVTTDAADARVDVLNKVDSMSIAADNARIEIAPIGSVTRAEVSGNKVSIGGSGTLVKADITGEGACISTSGTTIKGENTYIPPVIVATPPVVPAPTLTLTPTLAPTPPAKPTEIPTGTPSTVPTGVPTTEPTGTPTTEPTGIPTETPTTKPTGIPTETPTTVPTEPTGVPTAEPTEVPTGTPTTAVQYFEYEQTDDGNIQITRLKDKSLKAVVIPDKIDGVPVTSIGDYAFQHCSSLTSITIPDSVTSIGNNAFLYCDKLVIFTPKGSYAEEWAKTHNCSVLYLTGAPEPITEVQYFRFVQTSEKDIQIMYFKDNSLEAVVIPDKIYGVPVTSIGASAFAHCSALTSITIPDSVTSIRYYAFLYCNKLVIFTPKGSYAEEWAKIHDCSVLYLTGAPEPITEAQYFRFVQTSEKDIQITKFKDDSLEAVVIPDKIYGVPVTSIGEVAFFNCSSLTSITIPDSVTSIGDHAFLHCSSLTSITIPDSVTSIKNGAFSSCSSLTSITIPDSVTSIGNGAFSVCDKLVIFTPKGSYAEEWAKTHDCSVLYLTGAPEPITEAQYFGFVQTSEKDIQITECKDYYLEAVVIPDKIYGVPVTSIGDYAFLYCSALTSITIPGSVTSIGASAFADCSALTSITILDGVTSIGASAFADCSALTSITIPGSVTSIGDYAFQYCSSLTSITIPGSVTSIGASAFAHCSALTSITILDGVTSIGDYAFASCSSLTSITIPDSVTSIGVQTFSVCDKLVIFTPKGSYAEEWAVQNGYNVQYYTP